MTVFIESRTVMAFEGTHPRSEGPRTWFKVGAVVSSHRAKYGRCEEERKVGAEMKWHLGLGIRPVRDYL